LLIISTGNAQLFKPYFEVLTPSNSGHRFENLGKRVTWWKRDFSDSDAWWRLQRLRLNPFESHRAFHRLKNHEKVDVLISGDNVRMTRMTQKYIPRPSCEWKDTGIPINSFALFGSAFDRKPMEIAEKWSFCHRRTKAAKRGLTISFFDGIIPPIGRTKDGNKFQIYVGVQPR